MVSFWGAQNKITNFERKREIYIPYLLIETGILVSYLTYQLLCHCQEYVLTVLLLSKLL